jgi:uncharacterized membrane-anchored protein YitT (DUF2179 family)
MNPVLRKQLHSGRIEAQRILLVLVGCAFGSAAYVLFQVPHNIVGAGLSGVSLIINHFTGWSIGLLIFLMNLPLLVLGYFELGRWRFLVRTTVGVLSLSFFTDFFNHYLPLWLDTFPITDDKLLSAVYGGLLAGVAAGIVYRAGGTMGGTSILGRILQRRTGMPLSQTTFYTDGVVILAAGLVFGWQVAMYAFLALFLAGLAADYTLEGPSSTRTATIITNRPIEISAAILDQLQRGASYWQVTGAYTGEEHYLVLCTISRPQVVELKRIVAVVDATAFVTIGLSHQALGSGFNPLKAPE